MSRTQVKNGTRVWSAVCALAGEAWIRPNYEFTTREIALRAGMSKPTVKYYMEILVRRGIVEKSISRDGVIYWNCENCYE